MHERKKTMADLSCGAIALPGGVGTLDELFEIITWRQLGLYEGNVVIANAYGFYDMLLAHLKHTDSEHVEYDNQHHGYYYTQQSRVIAQQFWTGLER